MTQGAPTRRASGLDAQLRVSLAAVAVSGAALAAASVPFFGLSAALSVAVGAGLATANLWALARIVAALLPDESRASTDGGAGTPAPDQAPNQTVLWAFLGLLKMFALFGVVWLLMRHGFVSGLGLVVGFGALPIGIAIGSLVSHRGAPRHEPGRRV
jgi:hypothetical protein